MRSLMYSVVTVCLAVSAAGAVEPVKYSVCRQTAEAVISEQCVMAAKVVLNADTKASEAACADTNQSNIQQCVMSVDAILSNKIDAQEKQKIEAVACSGGSVSGKVQACIKSGWAAAEGSPRDANLTLAFACSGNTEPGLVQSCLNGRNFEIKEKSRFQLISDLIGAE